MTREEAIKVIKDNWPESRHQLKEALQTLIPELQESEDERIKKEIIQFLQLPHPQFVGKRNQEKWIAWLKKQGEKIDVIENFDTEFEKQVSHLIASAINKEHEYNQSYVKWTTNALLNYAKHELEKQSEQNPTDKVEPKFEIEKGKWYVCNTPRYRDFVVGKAYYCPKNGMLKPNENEMARYVARHCFHLWTIQDAKDGDVISFNDGHGNDCIELIKSIIDNKIEFWFCLTNGNCCEAFDGITPYTNFASRESAIPATKEQCDLLFSKMNEAGYEWSDKDRKLIKMK